MTRPARAHSDQARGYTLVQIDSIFTGVVASGATFLPVFLVRLGASGTEVGLLTAIPAFVAFTMAIPLGRWLQRRRNIVPWYSGLRLVGWSSYAVIAVGSALLPANVVLPAILGIWALASLPAVAGLVAFPIVMDGAAGPQGRFDLLGRRWAIACVVNSLTMAVAGQALVILAFPANFEALFVAIFLAGVGSFAVSRRIVLPDYRPAPPSVADSARTRIRAPIDLVRANRSFTRFELRSLVYTASTGLAMPLLPLLYVRELGAPNNWVGIIAAAQAAGAVIGYIAVRKAAQRLSAPGILLPALFAAAAVPATLSAVGWLPAVVAIAFVGGMAAASVQLALFDELMSRIPPQHGVTFSSVDQSLQNLGLIIAPSLGGFLAVAIGTRHSLVVAAAVGVAALALFAFDWRQGRGCRRQGAGDGLRHPAIG